MFTFIGRDTITWLMVPAVVLAFMIGIPILRIRLRRRMRKKEWSALHEPTTIDFTGRTGLVLKHTSDAPATKLLDAPSDNKEHTMQIMAGKYIGSIETRCDGVNRPEFRGGPLD